MGGLSISYADGSNPVLLRDKQTPSVHFSHKNKFGGEAQVTILSYIYTDKKYPIYWGQQTALPAKAFYITDELGVEEQFTQELFDTNFKLQINILTNLECFFCKKFCLFYKILFST